MAPPPQPPPAATGGWTVKRCAIVAALAVSSLIAIYYLFLAPPATIGTEQLLDGIYCHRENCYDVLGMNRTSTRSEISKAYRKLAKQHHPDLQRGSAEKRDEAEERFKLIANAYEILKEEESRTDYDYMLDNPQEYYAHYYRYYRRRSAKVDVRWVVVIAITIVSAIQYYSARQRYEDAIRHFVQVPKYRFKALEIIAQREKAAAATGNGNGHHQTNGNGVSSSAPALTRKSAGRAAKLSKTEQRERAETQIREVIIETMDIQGAYAPPTWRDVLWVQLLVSPWTLAKYVGWLGSWTWRFRVCGQEFGAEEKLYLIRRQLGMGVHEFELLDEATREEYVELELWKREEFAEWKREQEEEQTRGLAESAKHKQARRYMKNHAPARMNFDE